jgi:hypothetical protein
MKPWLPFALILSFVLGCQAPPGVTPKKLGAVTIVPSRTQVNVTQAVAISDGTNLVGVTAGGALNVNATIGGGTPSLVSANIGASSGFAKASAGTLFSISCNNRNAANRWIQVFNSASGPTGGATPFMAPWLVPAGGLTIVGSDHFTAGGISFSTGIAWGVSTTSATFTAGTASDHDCNVIYL